MPTAVNSGGRFWPPNRNSPDENQAFSRYPAEIEALLEVIDRVSVNPERADEEPTGLDDGRNFYFLLAEVGSEWISANLPRVTTASLWFIIAVYLEARREPRCWYEISRDHTQHIMRVLSLDQEPYEGDSLSRSALVLAYLMDHNGWAPNWFRPLPEAWG